MKWHYASLSEYPQTCNPCLVETPDAYRVMWYSDMDKRWYSDADKQYSDDDPYNCFKWVYIDEILEAMTWGGTNNERAKAGQKGQEGQEADQQSQRKVRELEVTHA